MCQDPEGGFKAAGVGQEVEEKEEVFSGPGSKNANGLFGLSAAFFHRFDGPLRGRVKKLIFFVADAPHKNKLECLALGNCDNRVRHELFGLFQVVQATGLKGSVRINVIAYLASLLVMIQEREGL